MLIEIAVTFLQDMIYGMILLWSKMCVTAGCSSSSVPQGFLCTPSLQNPVGEPCEMWENPVGKMSDSLLLLDANPHPIWGTFEALINLLLMDSLIDWQAFMKQTCRDSNLMPYLPISGSSETHLRFSLIMSVIMNSWNNRIFIIALCSDLLTGQFQSLWLITVRCTVAGIACNQMCWIISL